MAATGQGSYTIRAVQRAKRSARILSAMRRRLILDQLILGGGLTRENLSRIEKKFRISASLVKTELERLRNSKHECPICGHIHHAPQDWTPPKLGANVLPVLHSPASIQADVSAKEKDNA